MLSGSMTEEGALGLEQALEALIASEPFERLLLERARPIVAHAEAGEDAVVAGLARALDAPVLAVSPGPHEAEALAAEVAAYLGDDRVGVAARVGGAAVRGHRPDARDRRPPRRRGPPAARGDGRVRARRARRSRRCRA